MGDFCPYNIGSWVIKEKMGPFIVGRILKGFAFQGILTVRDGYPVYRKAAQEAPCPRWYAFTKTVCLLDISQEETIKTLVKYSVPLYVLDLMPSLAEVRLAGLLRKDPHQIVLRDDLPDLVVPLAKPPRCIVCPPGLKFDLPALLRDDASHDEIRKLRDRFCRGRKLSLNAAKSFFKEVLPSRPSPYTLMTFREMESHSPSIEHLVPRVLWDPPQSLLIGDKSLHKNLDAAQDIYNMCFETSGVNQLRSSLPFGSFSDHNPEKLPTLLISGRSYVLEGAGQLLNRHLKGTVRSMLSPFEEVDALEGDASQICSARLPKSLAKSSATHSLFIGCRRYPCLWEPPVLSRGWVARSALWTLTVHWIAPFLSGLLKVKEDAVFWVQEVLPVLVMWDALYPVNDDELKWSQAQAAYCGYENIFVVYRRQNNPERRSYGQVIFN
jgi:hypothetical protein